MAVFPKDIIDCMRDCILAIFWPKDQIISFLKANGCTSRELNIVVSKKEEFNRVMIIETVFEKLETRDDRGLGQFRSMLNALINWEHFDPYYFDKLGKLE